MSKRIKNWHIFSNGKKPAKKPTSRIITAAVCLLVIAIVAAPITAIINRNNNPAVPSDSSPAQNNDANNTENSSPAPVDDEKHQSKPDDDNASKLDPLTADEARALLQVWMDSHPFLTSSELEPEYGEQSLFFGEFYSFCIEITLSGTLEVLVDKNSGELFHLSSLGWHEFEPLNDWYERKSI